jgi:hypothetical protein
MRTPHRALAVALVPVLAVLTACGGDDDDPASDTTTTTVGETTTSASDGTTTTTASTSPEDPEATTTTGGESPSGLVLRGDGLGLVELGASVDAAVAALTAELGAPTADTGWQSSFSSYGTCPGEQIRGVEWDALVLLFTDGATRYGSGEHLFSWRLSGAPPAVGTAAGLGFGATVADAQELYPGAVEVVPPEEPFPGFLAIEAEGGTVTAFLDGDVLTNLEAGAPCGE